MDQIKRLREECKSIVAKIILSKNNNESFTPYKQIYEDKKYLIKVVNELFGEEVESWTYHPKSAKADSQIR